MKKSNIAIWLTLSMAMQSLTGAVYGAEIEMPEEAEAEIYEEMEAANEDLDTEAVQDMSNEVSGVEEAYEAAVDEAGELVYEADYYEDSVDELSAELAEYGILNLSIDTKAYSATVNFTRKSMTTTPMTYYVIATARDDEDDNLFAGSEYITKVDASAYQHTLAYNTSYTYGTGSRTGENAGQYTYTYNLSLPSLTAATKYRYRILVLKDNKCYFVTDEATFTTKAAADKSEVTVGNVSYDIGAYFSKMKYQVTNPNNEELYCRYKYFLTSNNSDIILKTAAVQEGDYYTHILTHVTGDRTFYPCVQVKLGTGGDYTDVVGHNDGQTVKINAEALTNSAEVTGKNTANIRVSIKGGKEFEKKKLGTGKLYYRVAGSTDAYTYKSISYPTAIVGEDELYVDIALTGLSAGTEYEYYSTVVRSGESSPISSTITKLQYFTTLSVSPTATATATATQAAPTAIATATATKAAPTATATATATKAAPTATATATATKAAPTATATATATKAAPTATATATATKAAPTATATKAAPTATATATATKAAPTATATATATKAAPTATATATATKAAPTATATATATKAAPTSTATATATKAASTATATATAPVIGEGVLWQGSEELTLWDSNKCKITPEKLEEIPTGATLCIDYELAKGQTSGVIKLMTPWSVVLPGGEEKTVTGETNTYEVPVTEEFKNTAITQTGLACVGTNIIVKAVYYKAAATATATATQTEATATATATQAEATATATATQAEATATSTATATATEEAEATATSTATATATQAEATATATATQAEATATATQTEATATATATQAEATATATATQAEATATATQAEATATATATQAEATATATATQAEATATATATQAEATATATQAEATATATATQAEATATSTATATATQAEATATSTATASPADIVVSEAMATAIVGDVIKIKLPDIDSSVLMASGKAGIYADGMLTAVKKGTVKLYIPEGKKKLVVCKIKIEQPKLRPAFKLKAGKTKLIKLSGTKTPVDSWCVDDEKIAVIAPDGMLTAVSEGTAKVTARIGTHVYESLVTVKPVKK